MNDTTSYLLAIVVACLSFVPESEASDILPGLPQERPVAIVGGTLHPVSSPEIEHGTLLFDKGKITAIGTDIDIPEGAEQIHADGLHVYPGLLEAHSRVGLTEVGAIRASHDYRETGSLNPNASAHVSVNPDSEIIPVTRSNGVLLALTAPSGGLIAGKAAVLQLDGWTCEDLTLREDAAMIVNWPWDKADEDESKPQKPKEIPRLREFFSEARRYRTARDDGSDQRFDIRLEAMQPVLDRRIPLLVRADGLAEIRSAVAFAVEQNVRLIILGGYDAPMCADALRKHDVPVIVSAVHRNPLRRHDDYDTAYTLPRRLRDHRVRFCISGTDRSSTWNARNLPYHAGTAVAYGLSADDALRAVTLSPAEILGVADRVGSLEVGKDATLIVTSGSPLETTSQVHRAWIQGRHLNLDNKQRRLYRKYREKYKRANAHSSQ